MKKTILSLLLFNGSYIHVCEPMHTMLVTMGTSAFVAAGMYGGYCGFKDSFDYRGRFCLLNSIVFIPGYALCSSVPAPLIAAAKLFIPSIKVLCSNKICYRYEFSAFFLNPPSTCGVRGDADPILRRMDTRRYMYGLLGAIASSAVFYTTAYGMYALYKA